MEIIKTPLNREVVNREVVNREVVNIILKLKIIRIPWILWNLIDSQSIKFGKRTIRLINHMKKGNIESFNKILKVNIKEER